MHAVMANVDTTPDQVHCTMIFETESAIQAPETDLADDTGEDHEWAEVSDDDACCYLLWGWLHFIAECLLLRPSLWLL